MGSWRTWAAEFSRGGELGDQTCEHNVQKVEALDSDQKRWNMELRGGMEQQSLNVGLLEHGTPMSELEYQVRCAPEVSGKLRPREGEGA